MVRLAIADPPYLGRAVRWYSDQGVGVGYGVGVADHHPEAAKWDDPAAHVELLAELCRDYDGFAIAAAADSIPTYMRCAPDDLRIMVWYRRNAAPSGARVRNAWEPVIVRIPEDRRGRDGSLITDVLDQPKLNIGFAGSKPPQWTRWVLAALGYDPAIDEVTDLFAGSGAVAAAIDGMLL